MSTSSDWEIPQHAQPKPEDWAFDLDRTLAPVVTLRATIPADAFTAGTLGTERAGNGVLIRERRPGAHHRLPHHRGRDDLAQHQ